MQIITLDEIESFVPFNTALEKVNSKAIIENRGISIVDLTGLGVQDLTLTTLVMEEINNYLISV